MAKRSHPAWRKAVKTIGVCLMALILTAVFYVAVILGQPQNEDTAAQAVPEQPLLPASPAVNITQEGELNGLISVFPAPVMSFLSGSGLTLTAGSSYDMAFENGFARVASLIYTADWNGQPIELRVDTIYPARALSLMGKGDYRIAAVAGQPLAGLQSVRMENGEKIRFHAQSDEALYVLTVPKAAADGLSGLTRSLQIFGGQEAT